MRPAGHPSTEVPGIEEIFSIQDHIDVPPPGYICSRCLKSGHFIHKCPTLDSVCYDARLFKVATGIPTAMLRKGIGYVLLM